MTKGTITRLTADRGYGIVQTEEEGGGGVIPFYFHRNKLVGVAYPSLKEGQQVEFEIIRTTEGLKAINVRPAKQSR